MRGAEFVTTGCGISQARGMFVGGIIARDLETDTMRKLAIVLFGAILLASPASAGAARKMPAPDFAVGPQYETTHVYVAPEDYDRFMASFVATFGGTLSKQGVFQVTPTPSQTMSQLALTPAGTISAFGFKTPIPYPFGAERTGYLVTNFDAAVKAARADCADVIVTPFPDPIGRDAIVVWPGGVEMQLYWHRTPPNYAPLASVPENRVYVSALRVKDFLHAFLTFAHGKIVSDDAKAPGIEIGRPDETYRRIRIESGYGKMVVLVTDGQLPYPYGRELAGYDVADLDATLAKATGAGAAMLVAPYVSDRRRAAFVRFPGGYIAEIHSTSLSQERAGMTVPAIPVASNAGPIDRTDLAHWEAAWNSHDIDTVLTLFTPDVVINQPSNPKPLDLAGARGFFAMIFKAYPDFHIAVTDSVIEGLKAVSIERVTGTWSGPFTDPATGVTTPGNGRQFDHPGVMVLTYRPDHRISRLDIYWDRLMVDQQLGIKP
jgi:steroid delta-isomerase-like uncharacterized protein